jgi:hypothetical protein
VDGRKWQKEHAINSVNLTTDGTFIGPKFFALRIELVIRSKNTRRVKVEFNEWELGQELAAM